MTQNQSKHFLLNITLLAGALALSACGGGSNGTDGGVSNAKGDAASQAAAKLDHTCGISGFDTELLSKLNSLRAFGAVCGGKVMPSVRSLVWNQQLQNAATVHVQNMANNNFFSHTGLDGSTPQQRVAAAGYSSPAGENIGVGYPTIQAVFDGWVNSPPHCEGMMGERHFDVGVSCADSSTSRRYWVMDLGTRE